MNRMQRKFLLVSAAIHSLLLVLLIVGPAFMPKRQSPLVDLPVLHVIPSELIMAAVNSGVAQEIAPSPEEPKPTPQQQQPSPESLQRVQPEPRQQTQPAVTQSEPAPEKVTPPKVEKKPERKPEPKPAPKKEIVVQSTRLQKRESDDGQKAREQALAEERRRRQNDVKALENQVAKAVSGIANSLSKSTKIEITGTGGLAVANYSQAVKSIYDHNWIAPKTLHNDRAVAQVEVVVNHDGRILRDRILKRSGVRSLDDSVQATLDRVRARGLPPFPDGLKAQGELQKTFRINFDLRSKL
jgi:TonB family protein